MDGAFFPHPPSVSYRASELFYKESLTCHIPAHIPGDSNRDNCRDTGWERKERCKCHHHTGNDRLLTSIWPARSTPSPGRCHCKRIEVHRSCRPENSSIHLSDIRRDLCNKLRLHFLPHIDQTRKVLLQKLVQPALLQESLLTGTLSLFSQTSHQAETNATIAVQAMKDYWLSFA